MLDVECFSWLNRALESPLAPVVVLATNRGVCSVRGADGMLSPHGIPPDLLDRLLVVRTLPHAAEDILRILGIRARVESLSIDDDALAALAAVGERTSLRHAVQLLAPAAVLARADGREAVRRSDVDDAAGLFLSAPASAAVLVAGGDRFIA